MRERHARHPHHLVAAGSAGTRALEHNGDARCQVERKNFHRLVSVQPVAFAKACLAQNRQRVPACVHVQHMAACRLCLVRPHGAGPAAGCYTSSMSSSAACRQGAHLGRRDGSGQHGSSLARRGGACGGRFTPKELDVVVLIMAARRPCCGGRVQGAVRHAIAAAAAAAAATAACAWLNNGRCMHVRFARVQAHACLRTPASHRRRPPGTLQGLVCDGRRGQVVALRLPCGMRRRRVASRREQACSKAGQQGRHRTRSSRGRLVRWLIQPSNCTEPPAGSCLASAEGRGASPRLPGQPPSRPAARCTASCSTRHVSP